MPRTVIMPLWKVHYFVLSGSLPRCCPRSKDIQGDGHHDYLISWLTCLGWPLCIWCRLWLVVIQCIRGFQHRIGKCDFAFTIVSDVPKPQTLEHWRILGICAYVAFLVPLNYGWCFWVFCCDHRDRWWDFFFFLLTFGSCIELTSSVVIGTDGSLDDVATYAELSSATKVYGEFLPWTALTV